jgi:hypothetical protein
MPVKIHLITQMKDWKPLLKFLFPEKKHLTKSISKDVNAKNQLAN